jgi:hypothetical protein
MDNKNQAISFVDQLITIAEIEDSKNKKETESGDCWLVFNLKLLKNLIEKI